MQYLCAGAFLGLLLAGTVEYSSFFALYFAVATLILGSVLIWEKKAKRKSGSVTLPLFLFLLTLSLFIVRGQFIEEKSSTPEELYLTQKVELHIEDRKAESEYMRYTANLTQGEKEYRVYVRMSLYPLFVIGDTLCGEVALLPRETTLVSGDSKSTFDYDAYLRERGITGVYSFPKLTKCKEVEGGFLTKLTRERVHLAEMFQKSMGQREAHLAAATLFGSDELTKEEGALYKKAGISHIVALSGFNISIIIVFLFAIFFFLPFWLRMMVSLSVLTLYLLMVGVSGSLLRATIMSTISFIFLFRGSKTDAKRVLMLSGLILAVFYPESVLRDASLQLSFLAMGGVLFVYPALFERFTEGRGGFTKNFLILFLSTLSVTMLIAPYTAYLFSSVSLYGMLTTVLISFLVPSITVLGILFLLISAALPPLAVLISFPLSHFTDFVIVVAEKVSALPLSTLSYSLSGGVLLFYYGMVYMLCGLIRQKIKSKESGVDIKSKSKNLKSDEESEIIEGTIYF